MIHTVIFDVGGTLVDADSVFQSFAFVMDSSRKEELFRFMRPIFMRIYRDESRPEFWSIKQIATRVVKTTAEHFGLPDISPRVPELYADCYLGHARIFDDVFPVLEKLKNAGLTTLAVSDADEDVLEKELATFGLNPYLDRVIISSQVQAYKPSDKMVEAVKSACREPFGGILFVGDTEVDILTAAKMGAWSVLIRRNGEYPHPADYQISDMNEIFRIISDIKNE